MKKSREKLVVLSIDSLQSTDLEFLKMQPNFSSILSKCALVKNVREIYPTLTYPIHTTIITGVAPDKHGISHNQLPSITHENPNWNIMGSDWNWYSDSVKAYSLMDAANDNGLNTASVMWPVMGGQKPKHNLAEIWPNSKEPFLETIKKSCTNDVVTDYFEKYLKSYDWQHKTDMDSYAIDIATDMIIRHSPDLMLIHSTCLDHTRHVYGDENEMVNKCLVRVDGIVGAIMNACKDAGTYEETNFVFLGDHGHIDIDYMFNINVLFVKYGLIRVHDDKVLDYDAYSFSAGFSTHIMLKNKEDDNMKEKVFSVLKEIKSTFPEYIERIFTADEVSTEEGLTGEFSFVVEAMNGVLFSNDVTGDLIISSQSENYSHYKGMHGHHPSKGKKPPFIVYGPAISQNITIENGSMLDECPTLARLLNVEMNNMDGVEFQIFS
ncbi:MAG: alkaline phosphatase family protein [Sedimentibacter sp.]